VSKRTVGEKKYIYIGRTIFWSVHCYWPNPSIGSVGLKTEQKCVCVHNKQMCLKPRCCEGVLASRNIVYNLHRSPKTNL